MNSTIRSFVNAIRSLFGLAPLLPPLHTIKASWTVDASDVLRHEYGFDHEDEIASIMAEEIRNEIDSEIIQMILLASSKLHRINHRLGRTSSFACMQMNRSSRIKSFMVNRTKVNARR